MKSRIKQITPNGDFKDLNKYEVTMEDGTVFTQFWGKDSELPFKAGEEHTYTITKENQYGKVGKLQKPGGSTYSKNNESNQILWSVCLKEAVALYPHMEVDLEPLTGERFESKLDHVIAITKGLFDRSKKELS